MNSSILFVLLAIGANAVPLESNAQRRSLIPDDTKNTFEWRIRVGTPRIYHDVAISTASTHTFLAKVGFPSGTKNLRPYDPDRSNTSKLLNENYQAAEKMAMVFGSTYEDIIQFKKLDITHQFGGISNMVGQEVMAVDGQIGLAWVPYERTRPSKDSPIIHTLLADQKEKVYHVYTAPGPKLIKLGGPSFCTDEPLVYHPILKGKSIPTLTMTEFEVANYHMAADYPVIVDSSSPIVRFPRGVYSAVIKEFDAVFDYDLNRLIVECNSPQPRQFKFVINKKTTLKLDDYKMITDVGNTGKCALMAGLYDDDEETYTLGTPVLYEYCVSFDVAKNRIAFVKAPEDPPEE